MAEINSEPIFEDDRSVVIRLPKTNDEKQRKDFIGEHLHLDALSHIVGEYSPDFEGKITNIIKTEAENCKPMYLDNGGIAALEVYSIKFFLVIYSPIDFSIVKRQHLFDSGLCKYSMSKTPMGNILVDLRETVSGKRILTKYYCNQEGDLLWSKRYYVKYFTTFILNNDAIIVRTNSEMIIENRDEEIKIDFKTSPYKFKFDQNAMALIPYGNKGFICHDTRCMYVYDDNLKERSIPKEESFSNINPSINVGERIFFSTEESFIDNITLIDGERIIFSIGDYKLVTLNLGTNENAEVIKLDSFNVRYIFSIGNNLCLLIVEYGDSKQGVEFYDIEKKEILPSRDLFKSNGTITYIGTMSNNKILLFYHLLNSFLVYNVLTGENSIICIGGSFGDFKISKTDSVLALDYYSNSILIFN
jgi:hypothetical protein